MPKPIPDEAVKRSAASLRHKPDGVVCTVMVISYDGDEQEAFWDPVEVTSVDLAAVQRNLDPNADFNAFEQSALRYAAEVVAAIRPYAVVVDSLSLRELMGVVSGGLNPRGFDRRPFAFAIMGQQWSGKQKAELRAMIHPHMPAGADLHNYVRWALCRGLIQFEDLEAADLIDRRDYL